MDPKEEVAKPRKIALYSHIKHGFYTAWDIQYSKYDDHYNQLPDGQEREVPRSEYVRVSEPIEIRFRPLNSGEVMEQALATLNAEERKVLAELNQQLANIRERKKQLLALTHESQISEEVVKP